MKNMRNIKQLRQDSRVQVVQHVRIPIAESKIEQAHREIDYAEQRPNERRLRISRSCNIHDGQSECDAMRDRKTQTNFYCESPLECHLQQDAAFGSGSLDPSRSIAFAMTFAQKPPICLASRLRVRSHSRKQMAIVVNPFAS